MCNLLIPEYDPQDPQPYPGDIQPGIYEGNEIVELLRQHSALNYSAFLQRRMALHTNGSCKLF